jgi:E3 ubiquitin-protein ligase synoviolin
MDRVTREAIDERLRVLEGVSGAVHRCIDDLMRMRSALPSPTPQSSHHLSSSFPSLDSRLSSLNEQINDLTTDDPSHLTTHASGSENKQSKGKAKNEESGPSNSASMIHDEEA